MNLKSIVFILKNNIYKKIKVNKMGLMAQKGLNNYSYKIISFNFYFIITQVF